MMTADCSFFSARGRSLGGTLVTALACFTGLGVMPSAHAGNIITWVGNSSVFMEIGANWSGGSVPGSADLFFGAAGTAGTTLTDNYFYGD